MDPKRSGFKTGTDLACSLCNKQWLQTWQPSHYAYGMLWASSDGVKDPMYKPPGACSRCGQK